MKLLPDTITKTQLGILLVLIAGISWGCISLFIRPLSAMGLSAKDISSLRCGGAMLVLALAFLHFDRSAFRIRPKDMWCMAGCGIMSITCFNTCYFAALQRTTVGIAVILLYTSPIFVTLLSCFFFKERFTRIKGLSLLMVMVGCILVSGVISGQSSTGSLSPLVLLLGIGSGFFYALYTIFGRFAQQRNYSSNAITLWTFIFAGVCALFIINWRTIYSVYSANGLTFLAYTIGLVLFSTILSYYTYTAGLKYLKPSTAAIVAAVEPVMGTLVGIFFFHESLTVTILVGMLLIIAAFFLPDNTEGK